MTLVAETYNRIRSIYSRSTPYMVSDITSTNPPKSLQAPLAQVIISLNGYLCSLCLYHGPSIFLLPVYGLRCVLKATVGGFIYFSRLRALLYVIASCSCQTAVPACGFLTNAPHYCRMLTMNTLDERPEFIKGQQSGYDETSKHWRTRNGARVRKHRAMESYLREKGVLAEAGSWGFHFNPKDLTPVSNVLEEYTNVIEAAIQRQERASESLGPDPIPNDILTMMELSELFSKTEGDVFQLIEAPMDLSLRAIDIDCSDKGIQRELESIYDSETGVDINDLMSQLWLCSGIYGQAFPLELWEDDELKWVTLLPPKYVKVGVSGGRFALSLLPFGRETWTQELFEQQVPPMAYSALGGRDANETVVTGMDIPISHDACMPVREKSLRFQRYAVPPMARAFRAISSRRLLEEMIRATMEGYRNQLWLFLVGDPDHPPSVPHLNALRAQLETMSGERTGYLVWWNSPFKVEVIAPQTFDKMSGMDSWMSLTQHIYRQLGVHLSVVSGESAAGALGGGGDLDINVRVLLERTKFKRDRLIAWEKHLRASIASRQLKLKDKQLEVALNTKTQFARNPLEIEKEVKEWLMPYYQSGALSPQTFLQKGGFSYDAELERKKQHQPNEEFFNPPPTYSQSTVNPGTPEKESQTAPEGRPPASTPKQAVKASARTRFDGEPLFDEMLNRVFSDFDAFLGNAMDAGEFVNNLKNNVSYYARQFATKGYRDAGGAFGQPDIAWTEQCINFLNSYAGGLQTALETHENPANLYSRIYLWPQQTRNLAYMYGVQWAMREYGAKAWRRVLHPELSDSGPCEICMADSVNVHSIEEPFTDHPNGVCSMFTIAFYSDVGGLPFAEVPVPEKVTTPSIIRTILEELGKLGKAIIRRIRQ